MKKKILLFFCVWSGLLFSGTGASVLEEIESKEALSNAPLVINIVANRNGVGWNQDIDILICVLTDLGHDVEFVERLGGKRAILKSPPRFADINIFVEHSSSTYLPYAKKNYLLPNPEWLMISPLHLKKYDCILCRTKEVERIFKPLHKNPVFIGFTCLDRYQKDMAKNIKEFSI